MRILVLFFLIVNLHGNEFELKRVSPYKIFSNTHLINEIPYKTKYYNVVVEIPAGITDKWEVNHSSGHLEWEINDGVPRKVNFLGYPGNYGIIPQTILDEKSGGDGDPLDVIVLGPAVEQGSIQKVVIIGAMMFLDDGERDDKIIALSLFGPFKGVRSLSEMVKKYPDAIEIIKYWFEGYKGDKMKFVGYVKRKKAEALIEEAHKSWKNNQK